MSVLTSDKNPPGWWRERKFRRMLKPTLGASNKYNFCVHVYPSAC